MLSHGGVLFHDSTVDVQQQEGRTLVIDAPPLQAVFGSDVVEDLRTGLLWAVGAREVSSFDDAVATCERLEVGGASDWRLPERFWDRSPLGLPQVAQPRREPSVRPERP